MFVLCLISIESFEHLLSDCAVTVSFILDVENVIFKKKFFPQNKTFLLQL